MQKECADEAAKRCLIHNRVVAKGVQLRCILRQRVVMTAQKALADVLLHRLRYTLSGWDAAAERRDAQDELHSAAQARAWADGDFDADHGDFNVFLVSPHQKKTHSNTFQPPPPHFF